MHFAYLSLLINAFMFIIVLMQISLIIKQISSNQFHKLMSLEIVMYRGGQQLVLIHNWQGVGKIYQNIYK
jgi:hypothetical protein